MRLFFDTEFHDDGESIELISIGIVSEIGEEYHAVVEDADWHRIHRDDWLMENVVPLLPPKGSPEWKPRAQIAQEVVSFAGFQPEWWAYCGAYDFVALVQLCFGPLVQAPRRLGWPKHPMDISQWKKQMNVKYIPTRNPDRHDALSDAREVRDSFTYLRQHAADHDLLGTF